MKKLLIAGVTALALGGTVANAGEHGGHHDNSMHGHGQASHSPFYVVFKGLVITGDTASHGPGVTLDGNTGGGIGFDFGYKLTHNLALEFVTSYAGNSVTETVASTVKSRNATVTSSHGATDTTAVESTAADTAHGTTAGDTGGHSTGAGHSVTTDGSYFTYGLSLAYTMHLTERAGLLFKAGYEGENETINGLGIDATNDGFTYAVGAEVKLDKHYELVFEYEGSTIKGPRGSSLFAGVKYNF